MRFACERTSFDDIFCFSETNWKTTYFQRRRYIRNGEPGSLPIGGRVQRIAPKDCAEVRFDRFWKCCRKQISPLAVVAAGASLTAIIRFYSLLRMLLQKFPTLGCATRCPVVVPFVARDSLQFRSFAESERLVNSKPVFLL